MTVQRIILVIFALVTIASLIFLAYSMHEYFGVYTAVHEFSVKIEKFSVVVSNASHALAETFLVIQNPSAYTFEVNFILQKLYLDDALFGMKALDMKIDPIWMGPVSNAAITVRIDVGSVEVGWLAESEEKNWDTLIHVGVAAPIIGDSLVRLREKLVPIANNIDAPYSSRLCTGMNGFSHRQAELL